MSNFTRIGTMAFPGQLFLRATAEPFRRNISLRLAVVDGTRVTAAVALEMRQQEEHQEVDPFLTIGFEQAQVLMDELWNCGVRPTEGAGSAGAMAAKEAHLQDMRTLVFNPPGKA